MWLVIQKYISSLVPTYIKKTLTSLLLKAAGVTGGFYSFIISKVLLVLWKKISEALESSARIADQAKIDAELLKKHDELIRNGAPESEIIKIEQDILNGGRKPKPKPK